MSSRPVHVSKLLTAMLLIGTAHFSCRPASYEIIKPKKSKSVDRQGDPTNLGPTDPGPPAPLAANVPPTARVEIIWDGQSVTKVRVNHPVTIRPTADTVDPDDIGKTQCANPGIVTADYTVESNKPSASRPLGCESLGVPYTFTKTGEYTVDMLVTSNENETAFASMTVLVLSETAPLNNDGGFTIQAIPMLAKAGEEVGFYGFCQTKKAHTVSWTYGDNAAGVGAETKHAYASEGQYRVDATCTETDNNGRSWKAALTIVIIGDSVVIPGQPTGPTPPVGGDDSIGSDDSGSDDGSGGGDDGDPGQNPGQKKPNQSDPSQKPRF